jgi:hypothetical protein
VAVACAGRASAGIAMAASAESAAAKMTMNRFTVIQSCRVGRG